MNKDCRIHAYNTASTKNKIIIVFRKDRIDVVSPIEFSKVGFSFAWSLNKLNILRETPNYKKCLPYTRNNRKPQ